MTNIDFNSKQDTYLKAGCWGMDIEHVGVIEYLDSEFTKEVEINPAFNYRQIKLKFDLCRIYANSTKIAVWEKEVDSIIANI